MDPTDIKTATKDEHDTTSLTFFLQDIGYSVKELEVTERFTHGWIIDKFRDIPLFFKLANTTELNAKIENEIAWNNQINNIIYRNRIRDLGVPRTYEYNSYNGFAFYITQDVSESDSKRPQDEEIQLFKDNIDTIVDYNIFLFRLGRYFLNLPHDSKRAKAGEILPQKFIDIARYWYEDCTKKGFKSIDIAMRCIDDQLPKTYQPGVTHGLFTPEHIFKKNGRITLVDGEHSSTLSPQFYDVVHCFHRLITKYERTDIATEYLKKFIDRLYPREKNVFKASLPSTLASRILGGLWEVANDKFPEEKSALFLNEKLLNCYINGNIIEKLTNLE